MEIVVKLRVDRGDAAARQMERVVAESDGKTIGLVRNGDGVLGQCETCCAFDGARHTRIAGTPAASVFCEKMQVVRFFWATRLLCARWMSTRSIPSELQYVRSAPGKYRASFAAPGLQFTEY